MYKIMDDSGFLSKNVGYNKLSDLQIDLYSCMKESEMLLQEIKIVQNLYPDVVLDRLPCVSCLELGESWFSELVHPEVDRINYRLFADCVFRKTHESYQGILYKIHNFGHFKTRIFSALKTNVSEALLDLEKFEPSLLDALKAHSS